MYYKLDEKYQPLVYGGMPKDDFCKDGQVWGTCIYNWEQLAKTNYKYMLDKIKLVLEKYDVLRLDHFLGYTEHYEINAKKHTQGKWVKAGGEALFEKIAKAFDMNRIVIEDLGLTKTEATKVRNKFNLKGRCVIQLILENAKNSNPRLGHRCRFSSFLLGDKKAEFSQTHC